MSALFSQMLPLLVFLLVDMLFTNTVISIVSAVLFALFQMVFTFRKNGKPDYLVLIDVALIAGLGMVSLFLKNDLFFKLKPAIIELLMAALVFLFSFSKESFILNYLGRFSPAHIPIQKRMVPTIRKMCWGVSLYTLLHAGVVWYTAYHSSRKIWALVSGPGYFVLFIPLVVFLIAKRLRRVPPPPADEYRGGYVVLRED